MCIRIIILYNFVVYIGILEPLNQGNACFKLKTPLVLVLFCL